MDRRLGRRSPRGLIEETRHIAVADLRHDLAYNGRDRQPIIVQGGPADGLTVTITWSRLRYGWRPWLTCPKCARPCGRLYAAQTVPDWRCRDCQGLDYRAQRKRPHAGQRREHWQLLARGRAVRRRLGQSDGWIGAPLPLKPRGMHSRTYLLLIEELIEHERRALNHLKPRVSRSLERLMTRFGVRTRFGV